MALGTNDPDGGLIVKLQEGLSLAVIHHPDRRSYEMEVLVTVPIKVYVDVVGTFTVVV
jgi:hypothetical protein